MGETGVSVLILRNSLVGRGWLNFRDLVVIWRAVEIRRDSNLIHTLTRVVAAHYYLE